VKLKEIVAPPAQGRQGVFAMRTSAITIVSLAAAASASAGNIEPGARSFWTQARQGGVTTQYAENNEPRPNGDLSSFSLEGAVSISAGQLVPSSTPFFALGGWVQFNTGAHPFRVDQADFDADLRIVNASADQGATLDYTITAGVFSAEADAMSDPQSALVFELATIEGGFDGPGFEDVFANMDLFPKGEGADFLTILPSFESYYFGFAIELGLGGALDQGPAQVVVEFGGDTSTSGLGAGLDLQPLPAPGAAAIFTLASAALAGRRRRS
jgi:hypothetical protein